MPSSFDLSIIGRIEALEEPSSKFRAVGLWKLQRVLKDEEGVFGHTTPEPTTGCPDHFHSHRTHIEDQRRRAFS